MDCVSWVCVIILCIHIYGCSLHCDATLIAYVMTLFVIEFCVGIVLYESTVFFSPGHRNIFHNYDLCAMNVVSPEVLCGMLFRLLWRCTDSSRSHSDRAKCLNMPITVDARYKARTVFARSNAESWVGISLKA
jgi:hypothetical protein